MKLPMPAPNVECPHCGMSLYRSRQRFDDRIKFTHEYILSPGWGCANEGRVFALVKGVLKFLGYWIEGDKKAHA